MAASDTDADFCSRLRESIAGMENGAFLFDDPMPLQMHLHRRRSGPGAYHELDMFDRATIEASPLFQELFFPFGIRYAVGLSVPLVKGEAMICVGFESADAPGYEQAAMNRLNLLVPALESAVRQQRALGRARAEFTQMIDRLVDPVALVTRDGRTEHCNRALRRLLEGEPEEDALRAAIRALAESAEADEGLHPCVGRTVNLAAATYCLRLGRPPASVGRGWLVLVDRQSPYPPAVTLEQHLGLTAREAEVALLLAEGHSNQEIADMLSISSHTARHHVQGVLGKLDISSRAAVAHELLSISP